MRCMGWFFKVSQMHLDCTSTRECIIIVVDRVAQQWDCHREKDISIGWSSYVLNVSIERLSYVHRWHCIPRVEPKCTSVRSDLNAQHCTRIILSVTLNPSKMCPFFPSVILCRDIVTAHSGRLLFVQLWHFSKCIFSARWLLNGQHCNRMVLLLSVNAFDSCPLSASVILRGDMFTAHWWFVAASYLCISCNIRGLPWRVVFA
jgi:hypothetical protein